MDKKELERRIQRDLNPHMEARVAMLLWNKEYASQTLGSMGFYGSLSNSEKEICKEACDKLLECKREASYE